jgi:hypothetical protein
MNDVMGTYFLRVIATAVIGGFAGLFVAATWREIRYFRGEHRFHAQLRELRARDRARAVTTPPAAEPLSLRRPQ